ncbi:MAG: DUF2442 domain-containing protein [Chloroflexi bacterium]|nr:DUF2442 domain-containing protein [Chloroflexota bacterium]
MDVTDRAVAVSISFDDEMVWVKLTDRRVIGMPLDFFPWLEKASPKQRERYEISPISIYWPDLEDGIDMHALITGQWAKPANAGS